MGWKDLWFEISCLKKTSQSLFPSSHSLPQINNDRCFTRQKSKNVSVFHAFKKWHASQNWHGQVHWQLDSEGSLTNSIQKVAKQNKDVPLWYFYIAILLPRHWKVIT